MNSAGDKIKTLVNEVKGQVQKADEALEKALQQRENIMATPIPRQEVKANFADAVDNSANRFKETLTNTVYGRARKRDAIGVNRCPEVIRKQGRYNELNIDAINFFMGDLIKLKLDEFIDEIEYFGVEDGISDKDYKNMIDEAETKIEKLKINRDAVVIELNSIFK